MRIYRHILPLAVLPLLAFVPARAQITLSGSIQSDILVPEDDDKIGTEHTSDWALTNTYLDLKLGSKYVDAGGRFEFLQHPLPGYEPDFKGWGVPHFYVKGHYKNIERIAVEIDTRVPGVHILGNVEFVGGIHKHITVVGVLVLVHP